MPTTTLSGITRTMRRAIDLEGLLEAGEVGDVYEWFGERSPEGTSGGRPGPEGGRS